MARAIAICEGGPLDGLLFSVEVDADGSPPPPLESRAEVTGVLYVPGGECDLPEFPAEDADGNALPHPFGWAEHERAFTYAPEEGS